jgi:hypothetical protein
MATESFTSEMNRCGATTMLARRACVAIVANLTRF